MVMDRAQLITEINNYIYTNGIRAITAVEMNKILTDLADSQWNLDDNTDVYVTGGTYSAGTATFTNSTGGTFTVTGLSTGYTNTNIITGGTYNATTGIETLTNNTGGSITISGFYIGYTLPANITATTVSATSI